MVGQWQQAVCLEAIYTGYRERKGASLPPAQRDLLKGWLAPSRHALSSESFDLALEAGTRIPVEQAVTSILERKPVFEKSAWEEKIS
jgi:hypothetical protein